MLTNIDSMFVTKQVCHFSFWTFAETHFQRFEFDKQINEDYFQKFGFSILIVNEIVPNPSVHNWQIKLAKATLPSASDKNGLVHIKMIPNVSKYKQT